MKIVLWFQTAPVFLLKPALNALARTYNSLEFVGLISEFPIGEGITINGKKLSLIEKSELTSIEHDLIVVCGKDASLRPILDEASELSIDPDKLVLDRTILVPNFTLEKYNRLRHSQLSILSQNCWGGLTYHLFGLPFLSPFINMFFSTSDFIKLLRAPRHYMDSELRFLKKATNPSLKIEYPIFLLNDVRLNMNHYDDFDRARENWELRRLKINWYNLLIVAYTEDRKALEEFDQLPFGKKVCFVPFETTLHSGFQIPSKFIGDQFWKAINGVAQNKVQCFDLWDLLLYGKKTPLKV